MRNRRPAGQSAAVAIAGASQHLLAPTSQTPEGSKIAASGTGQSTTTRPLHRASDTARALGLQASEIGAMGTFVFASRRHKCSARGRLAAGGSRARVAQASDAGVMVISQSCRQVATWQQCALLPSIRRIVGRKHISLLPQMARAMEEYALGRAPSAAAPRNLPAKGHMGAGAGVEDAMNF